MKISIITSTFNSGKTVADTLESVRDQTHGDIEHILIDGGSTDDTNDIIKRYPHVSKHLSEKDKGIYDGLNKGLKAATGDFVGFLHSDDYFVSKTVVEEIVAFLSTNPNLDGAYGNIVFVEDKGGKIIRKYNSRKWQFNDFKKGKMPAHPSFFARKSVYDAYSFNLDYRIAADFDQMLRCFSDDDFHFDYHGITTTCMRMGGASTDGIKSNLKINSEILAICKANGLPTNLMRIYSKYPSRLVEFLRK